MSATSRPVSAAVHKTAPRLLASLFVGALTLAIVVETAPATDPHIELIKRAGTNWITIHFNTEANRTYTLQYSSRLNYGSWSNIYTAPADADSNRYTVLVPAKSGSGFFRLSVRP